MKNNGLGIWLFLMTFLLVAIILPHAVQPQQYHEASGQPNELEDIVEDLLENETSNDDYSDLADQLRFLVENPVNLNTATKEELESLFFLNTLLVYHLIAYRENYGQLLSIYELQVIDGYDVSMVRKIEPFITVDNQTDVAAVRPAQVARYGVHRLLFRIDRVIEKKAGYATMPGSTVSGNASRYYLGSPEHILLKYGFRYKDRIRMGFIAEKDPGEYFFRGSVNPVLRSQLPAGGAGFDYYSAHLLLKLPNFVKKVVFGDYHLQFGQGLTLWTGYAFGLSGEATQVQRMSASLRPHTGSEENKYLRGVASVFRAGPISATIFFSRNRVDATVGQDDGKLPGSLVARFYLTGYHRTTSEWEKKNTLSLMAYGGRLLYKGAWLKTGLTVFGTSFDIPLTSGAGLHNQFDFRGHANLNAGFDYYLLFQRVNFFGEFSMSRNGVLAMLHGLNTQLHPRLSVSLLYRHYPVAFQNSFSNPFTSGSFNNEKGFYAGIKYHLSAKWIMQAYADSYTAPWPKFQVTAPSRGRAWMVALEYLLSKDVQMLFRMRVKGKQTNDTVAGMLIRMLDDRQKSNFRAGIRYAVGETLSMASRVEVVKTNAGTENNGRGMLIFQDVRWTAPNDRLQVDFRLALFDTDTYEERIYALERDVLSSFTVPAFFHRGSKLLALFRYEISDFLTIWFRWTRIWYMNQNQIGSGLEAVHGNIGNQVKIQFQVNL